MIYSANRYPIFDSNRKPFDRRLPESRFSLLHILGTNRSHLRAVAYRMLGSVGEADDALQECWLRVSRAGTSGVDNLEGWLTTVLARVCLNMLRSRKSRRERSLSVHAANPVLADEIGITFMMLDADIVAVSPASVWRVLGRAGLLRKWSGKPSKKGTGFEQPPQPQQHWHINASYLNVCATSLIRHTDCFRAVARFTPR
jgi:hypothetical protein